MRRTLAYIAAALILCGCNDEYKIVDELGVTSHTLNIARTPGETHIAVYSTGTWTVTLDKDVDWASLNKISGEGLGDFVLSWSANYGAERNVNILVSGRGKTETISIIQAGYINSPYITLGRSRIVLPRQQTAYSVTMKTNLDYSVDEFQSRVAYDGETAEEWIHDCRILKDKVEFSVKENNSGAERKADLVVYKANLSGGETFGAISVVQSPSDPVLRLSSDSGEYFSNEENYFIPAKENNIWALDGVSVTSDSDWLTNMALNEDGLAFSTSDNTGGSNRQGVISISYGQVSASYTVHQAGDKLLSFSELRERVPGVIRGNLLIEGFIVSDHESPNLCSSPQTGQFSFDRSENGRTAYIESTDGAYGLCLKFDKAEDNTIPRWSKVRVRLDGTLLESQSNPSRFTLRNVSADNFTLLNDGSSPVEKVRSIKQLKDDDIYTYVSLQDIEIMSKDGAFTNADEGYSLKDELNPLCGSVNPRWDVAPLLCSDVNGSYIHMLTNAAAPWRRTGEDVAWGSCVPQGAGMLSGILVADEVVTVRWGDLWKYQIRPLSKDDIDLNGMPFSKVICEWNWNEDGISGYKTANLGKGTLTTQSVDTITDFTWDYNNPHLPTEDGPNGHNWSTNCKGRVDKGALSLTQIWWDSENKGGYFDVSFTTSSLSGTNLVIGIVWGHGSGASSVSAPSHWNVLYSTDNGKEFKTVPDTQLKQRYCAWWSNPATSQDATPGYTEHLIKLPPECFGKKTVTVRFQVADNVTDIVPSTSPDTWRQALGIEKGKLSPSDKSPVRIGSIIVRYN